MEVHCMATADQIRSLVKAYNTHNDEKFKTVVLQIAAHEDSIPVRTLYEYAEKDSHIQVYAQENLGPGGSTNTGLDKATGKYIYLMDADDILDLNALEEFHNIMEEKDVDMIIFPSIDYDEDTGKYEKKSTLQCLSLMKP